jgi:NAD(P)H-hydrate epimerase
MSQPEPVVRLTRAQVREIDRRATEEYHIPGIVLMENAARGVADVAVEMIGRRRTSQNVLIVAGGGNNGGDGFAVARHLDHDPDANVLTMLTVDPKTLRGDALANWNVLNAIGLAVEPLDVDFIRHSKPDLIIDAIFGTGLDRPPRPPFKQIADAINGLGRPVLSIDVPSGLDCDVGTPFGACVRATRTVTFVAEKAGFANPTAREYLGRVSVNWIGVPARIVQHIVAGAA